MDTAANASGVKSFRDWLTEGEMLYNTALAEFNALEADIEQLEQRLAAKRAEVNQIAHVIGKPPVEGTRRLTAQIIDAEPHTANAAPTGNIARALSGRGAPAR
ncbi:MAG: hypothetical protein JO353_11265 [Phycisphaerae bacterium]|nr:hypothetical protein [Phycisphaerae bacterium]